MVWGSVGDHVGVFWSLFWEHGGVMLGSFCDSFGILFRILLGSCRDRLGIILESFWDKFGISLGSLWDTCLALFPPGGGGSPSATTAHSLLSPQGGPYIPALWYPPPLTSVGRCWALGTVSRQLCGAGLRIPYYHVMSQGMTLCKSRARHPTQRRYGPGSSQCHCGPGDRSERSRGIFDVFVVLCCFLCVSLLLLLSSLLLPLLLFLLHV